MRVLIAVLLAGALLLPCCGIVNAAAPANDPVEKTVYVHYQDNKDHVKTVREDAKVNANSNAARGKKPSPTQSPSATPTPAPEEPVDTIPTVTPTPAPEEPVDVIPTATATPAPEEPVDPIPTVTPSPAPEEPVDPIPTPAESDIYDLKAYKWNAFPVGFYINPSVAGVSADAVTNEVKQAFEAWDAVVAPDLYTYKGTTTASTNVMNGRNEIFWAPIGTTTNVVAITTTWSNSTGIVEADIKMNSDKPWGIDRDGEETAYTLTDALDIRNIATHEVGHVTCLKDLYATGAIDLTMYCASQRGEVKKRSLGLGDILGAQALYGA